VPASCPQLLQKLPRSGVLQLRQTFFIYNFDLRSYNLTANVSALPQVGILKIVCPVEMLKRKMIIKLLKSLLEKVN
jgi:hypothetical protein